MKGETLLLSFRIYVYPTLHIKNCVEEELFTCNKIKRITAVNKQCFFRFLFFYSRSAEELIVQRDLSAGHWVLRGRYHSRVFLTHAIPSAKLAGLSISSIESSKTSADPAKRKRIRQRRSKGGAGGRPAPGPRLMGAPPGALALI